MGAECSASFARPQALDPNKLPVSSSSQCSNVFGDASVTLCQPIPSTRHFPSESGSGYGGSSSSCSLPVPRSSLADARSCEECCFYRECKSDAPIGTHPLLVDGLPRKPSTPRGPAPPWARANRSRNVDRTSTGATPPRTLQSLYLPPGLPPGDYGALVRRAPDLQASCRRSTVEEGEALSCGEPFLRELVRAIRCTSSTRARMNSLLMHAYDDARQTLLDASKLPADDASEGAERVREKVASFLSRARDPDTGETLLGLAVSHSGHETVEQLLASHADPKQIGAGGRTALAAAVERGNRVSLLLVLDRLQGQCPLASLEELSQKGAWRSLANAKNVQDICTVFEDMRAEAETRHYGPFDVWTGRTRGCHQLNGGFVLLDLLADPCSESGMKATCLLKQFVVGSALVRSVFARIPDSELELNAWIDQVGNGLRAAEQVLVSTNWQAEDVTDKAEMNQFVRVAQLRGRWQKMKYETLQAARCADNLSEFWQTHISADVMVSTLAQARGNVFQLLLIVLWVYTREAWLFHILDALTLATFVTKFGAPGARGSAVNEVVSPGRAGGFSSGPVALLFKALSPCAQLVHSALNYFEELGIRHEGDTYRPLSLSETSLLSLCEKVRVAALTSSGGGGKGKAPSEGNSSCAAGSIHKGVWLALAAHSFFSSMASYSEASDRLVQLRCNTLLVIRPHSEKACFPKHMSLRCSGVDDVLFPMGVLFHVIRITKTTSAHLATDLRGHGSWPVVMVEVAAADRILEVLETLDARSSMNPGELEERLDSWIAGASAKTRHLRMRCAGELLFRSACGSDFTRGTRGPTNCQVDKAAAQASARFARLDRAMDIFLQAAALAEAVGDTCAQAFALLARARCRMSYGTPDKAPAIADARKATGLLEDALGKQHPDTCGAYALWQALAPPDGDCSDNEFESLHRI